MSMKLTLCIINILFVTMLTAQISKTDSLDILVKKETNPSKRLELIKTLTDIAFGSDLEQAKKYALQGVRLAEDLKDKQWQPRFYEMLGRMYANLLVLDSATFYFNRALNGYISVDDKKGQATTYFKIGWVHKRKGELKEAMQVDLWALRLMEQIKDKSGIAGAMNRISEDLARQERTKEALEYAKKTIEFSKKNKIDIELAYAYKSAGDAEIAMYHPKEAYMHYDSAMTLFKKMGESAFTIVNIKNDRANALKRMGKWKEALLEYMECLKMAEEINYQNNIYVCYANIGEVNTLLGNYPEALKYQLKTVALQEMNKDISNLTENYGHVSTIYEKMGDYKNALKYQKLARTMRDSTAKIESDQAMSELMTQYETDKKNKTIAFQNATIAQQKKMQSLYIAIACLLAIILFGLYYSFQKRQKKNEQLTRLNNELDKRNHQNELLLKEIHHRVKNNLELVKSLLSLQSAQLSDAASREAMQASQNRVQSMGIIHQKLYQGENLGSIEMKDYFVNLGEGILDSFNAEDKVKIECAMETLELDVDTAVPIGLIVNELLTNALKYAFPENGSGHISISLARIDPEVLTLRVKDNGVGKLPGIKPHGTGFGSQLIHLLTYQLNGTMIEHNEQGTAVEFQFRIKSAA